jgi:hypothetical protein
MEERTCKWYDQIRHERNQPPFLRRQGDKAGCNVRNYGSGRLGIEAVHKVRADKLRPAKRDRQAQRLGSQASWTWSFGRVQNGIALGSARLTGRSHLCDY